MGHFRRHPRIERAHAQQLQLVQLQVSLSFHECHKGDRLISSQDIRRFATSCPRSPTRSPFPSSPPARKLVRHVALDLLVRRLETEHSFIVTFQSLWINELLVTQWTITSLELSPGFIGFLVALTALVLPWLALGWLAIRRRLYRAMGGFLFGALVYIGSGLFLLAGPFAVLP